MTVFVSKNRTQKPVKMICFSFLNYFLNVNIPNEDNISTIIIEKQKSGVTNPPLFLILLNMKRMVAFIFMCAFALIFLVSYMYSPERAGCGKTMNRVGQAGLTLSILMFFIFPGKKKFPKGTTGSRY